MSEISEDYQAGLHAGYHARDAEVERIKAESRRLRILILENLLYINMQSHTTKLKTANMGYIAARIRAVIDGLETK
jgi:hypothetical protein